MIRKATSGIVLALVLFGMLVSMSHIQPVEAEPRTWIVDDDGPADFHTIQEAINAVSSGDTIYVYNGTYYENVVVNKTVTLIGEGNEKTIIDAKQLGSGVHVTSANNFIRGFTIRNSSSGPPYPTGGIIVSYSTNNTIKDSMIVSNEGWGILVDRSNDNTILNNVIEGNGRVGLELYRSCNNSVTDNVIANHTDYYGLYLQMACDNTIIGNNLTGNGGGIQLFEAPGNILKINRISALWQSFGVDGWTIQGFINDIDTSNSAGDKPIYFWTDQHGKQVPSDAGYVGLVNCTDIVVRDLNLTKNRQGLLLAFTNNSLIINNNLTLNWQGILVEGYGSNTIAGNIITLNYEGISLYRTTSNRIFSNNLTMNGDGVYVSESSDNKLYHNNFVQNYRNQAYSYSSTDLWDNGYPSGGNYWSDYAGNDTYSGPYQNVTGSDGIGDEAYIIEQGNIDRYPLIGPFNAYDAGTWNGEAYSVDVVSNSTVSGFYFNPDEGAFLKFNVTGEEGTIGCCRVAIPKDLLWTEDGWLVLVGDQPVDYIIIPDDNYTYLYFTYSHSTKTITILGTNVVPEFPSAIILLLFMLFTILALVIAKRKNPKKTQDITPNHLPFL